MDNLAFDALLVLATLKTLRIDVAKLRFALSLVFAVTAAVLLPLVEMPGTLLSLCKIAIGALTILIALPKRYLRRYFWSFLLFLAYTFVLGGTIFAVFFLGKGYFSYDAGLYYFEQYPVGLYLFCIMAFAVGINLLVKKLKNDKKNCVFYANVAVKMWKKSYRIIGFLDSGNLLTHNQTPVCFAYGELKKAVKEEIAALVLSGEKVEKVHYNTASGKGESYAVSRLVTVNMTTKQCYIAVGKGVNTADILLNSCFLEG